MDWSLVARLRTQASERLSASLGDGQGPGSGGSAGNRPLHHRRPAAAEAQERLSAGLGAWSMLEQDSAAKAVFDALFGSAATAGG